MTVREQEENESMTTTYVSAIHDDWGTLVRIYVNNLKEEEYYVQSEDDWRAGLPEGATIRERTDSSF